MSAATAACASAAKAAEAGGALPKNEEPYERRQASCTGGHWDNVLVRILERKDGVDWGAVLTLPTVTVVA